MSKNQCRAWINALRRQQDDCALLPNPTASLPMGFPTTVTPHDRGRGSQTPSFLVLLRANSSHFVCYTVVCRLPDKQSHQDSREMQHHTDEHPPKGHEQLQASEDWPGGISSSFSWEMISKAYRKFRPPAGKSQTSVMQ